MLQIVNKIGGRLKMLCFGTKINLIKLHKGYIQGLLLVTQYVVLHNDFEKLILSIYSCILLMDVFNGSSLIQLKK